MPKLLKKINERIPAPAKNIGKSYINILTGGVYGEAKSYGDDREYLKQLKKAPKVEMGRKEIEDLARKGAFKGKQVVMKVVGGKNMAGIGVFKDFPGIEPIIATTRGLRDTWRLFLPNYTPGKDISIPNSIRPNYIKELHVIGNKGVEKVIVNKDFKIPSKLPLPSRLKSLAKPAIGLYGAAELLSLGLTGKTLAGRLLSYEKKRLIHGNHSNTPAIKQAAIGPLKMRAIKKALIAGAAVAGAGLALAPINYTMAHYNYKGKKEHPILYPTVSGLGRVGTVLAGTSAHGAITGMATIKGLGSKRNAATVGMLQGQWGYNIGSGTKETIEGIGETYSRGRIANPEGRAKIMNNPKEYLKSIAIPGAILSGVAAANVIYNVNRYYPISTQRLVGKLKAAIQGAKGNPFLYMYTAGGSKAMKHVAIATPLYGLLATMAGYYLTKAVVAAKEKAKRKARKK